MGLRRVLGVVAVVLAGALPVRASTVVAVDPVFAPVATALVALFADRTGHDLVLSVAPGAVLDQTEADVLLAPDADLPARLAESGQARADTLMTYATDPAAAAPRGAVLMEQAAQDPVARAFMDFLLTPEAWDVIVAHGFGAH